MELYYVGIRVRNLARSVRFYTRVLGLKVEVRGDHLDRGRGIWVGLSDPRSRQRFELNWYPRGSRFWTPYASGAALDHIGFYLGRVRPSTLVKEYRRLRRAGAGATAITPESTEGWQACVTDPDGNWIELFRRPTADDLPAEARARQSRSPGPRASPPAKRRRRRSSGTHRK